MLLVTPLVRRRPYRESSSPVQWHYTKPRGHKLSTSGVVNNFVVGMSPSNLYKALLFVFAITLQHDFAKTSDVLELGDADFDYIAAEHDTMLVEFFAPW